MQLLQGGANPNAHALSGNHPLTIAVRAPSNHGSASIVRYLLEAGANPNMFSVDGIPVLHDACIAGGDGEIADLLLKAGVGVNSPCPGRDFLNPLHIAAIYGNVAIVRELIKVNGCKLDVQAPTPTRCDCRRSCDRVTRHACAVCPVKKLERRLFHLLSRLVPNTLRVGCLRCSLGMMRVCTV